MTTDVIPSDGKLDIAKVLGGTFQVVGRNIVSFSILGLVLAGLPAAVIGFLQTRFVTAALLEGGGSLFGLGFFTNIALALLVTITTTAILQGALIYATVQDMNGRKPQVGEALATGLRNFLPLLVVSILLAIAVVCGLVLLVVPGIMIACAWCVAVPSLVADRLGIFDSFGRSADLTRGNRWRIFGLGVLLWIILLVIGMVFGSITTAVMFSTPGALQDPIAMATNPVNVVIQAIQQTISAVIGAALSAVLYVELRRAREGAGPQWLAAIFE